MSALRLRPLGCAIALSALLISSAFAQQAESTSNPLSSRSPISLMRAIELALENSSQLKLQRSQVALQMGVLQSAVGAFDPILTQDTSLSYLEEELTDTAKTAQRTTRNDIRDLIADFNERLADEQAVNAELVGVRANPTGATIQNADLRAQIALLNRLIEGQTNAAIRDELVLQRNNGLDADIAESNADIIELTSSRNTEIERLRKLGEAPTIDTTYDASIAFGLRKSFRNGWTLNASASMTLAGTDFKSKRRAPEFGGKGVIDLYRSKIGLDLLAPLGRGRSQFAAVERSSELDLQAAQALLEQQVAAVVRDTAASYWQLVGAVQRLAIARDSLTRQNQIGELTQALVTADQNPRSELARAGASGAEAQSRMIQSESAVVSARFALAQVMGLRVNTLQEAPFPADGFPVLSKLPKLSEVRLLELENLALRRRADFQAAILQTSSAEVLSLASEVELSSKHDLSLSLFATGVAEDSSVTTALDNVLLGRYTGPSASIGYSYERPWRNDEAEGRFAQQNAQLQQREILRDDISRRVRSGIALSLERLQRARQLVLTLREATTLYLESVVNERERLRTGGSTLINLLLTEERATNVLFSSIAAEANYATALVELRFAAGLLLSRDQQQVLLDERSLVDISAEELLAW